MRHKLVYSRPGSYHLTRRTMFRGILALITLMLLVGALVSMLPQNDATKEIVRVCTYGCYLGLGAIVTTFAPKS